ncbi:MAG: hypothetical protein LH618_15425, partial [Saprospiraceae bacterium]|nr:hypothetical protein [Saprospiraceae bacterium]
SVLTDCMMEDDCGRMWWVDFQNRVFYIDNGRIIPWENHTLRDSLPVVGFDSPVGLIVSGCGDTLWFGAHEFGAFWINKAGKWAKLPRPEKAYMQVLQYRGKVIGCRVSSVGNYRRKFSSSDIFSPLYFQWPGGGYCSERIEVTNGRYTSPKINRLQNNDWLLSAWGSHYLLRQGKILWTAAYPEKTVERVFEDKDGKILVAYINGGGVAVYNSRAALRSGQVSFTLLSGRSVGCIFKDREGGWWFATQEQGIFYCPSLASGVVDQPADLKEGLVSSVIFDGRSKLYAALKNGQIFAFGLADGTLRDISPPHHLDTRRLSYDPESLILFAGGSSTNIRRDGEWIDLVFKRTNDNAVGPPSILQWLKKKNPDLWWGRGINYIGQFDFKTKTYTNFLQPAQSSPRLFS